MDTNSCCNTNCEVPAINGSQKAVKIGLALVIATIAYNIFEAVIALLAGRSADSIALVGFGFDSLIEVSAAGLLLWRLLIQLKHTSEAQIEKTEGLIHRFVGATFYLLAAYIGRDAYISFSTVQMPQESLIGIILAILSLLIMPGLAWGKIRIARQINSKALEAEAKETIACSILSLILLVGLVANSVFGWWWADPVAGLCMIPWLLKEGTAGLKGQSCCG